MRIPPFLVLLPLLALAACDGGTGASSSAGGEYIGALQSPNGPEGAAMLEITGGSVQEISAASATLFRQPVSGGQKVMLIRPDAGRIEFRVVIADGGELPQVRVVQVVAPDDSVRPTTDGYAVTFTRTRGDP
ncbi:MAG TPA: hypothetical protein VHG93_19650 [Longimicrobium sp.]|nr:hypothetical protein [Longimicrobium sp.]